MRYLLISLCLLSTTAMAAGTNTSPPSDHAPPPLTAAQRQCMEKLLGKPSKNSRPAQEKLQKAAYACGVEMPQDAPPDDRRSPQ
ncbi:hypothetical protein [Marinobacterium lacunae]|uniref:hypothetical protein n=1 Tax=Marinobacterium lacunae TaxID=1232683 RepID=UPI00055BCFCA|nr:hypothetical protein [Marinobacterium lacunae]